MELCSHPDYHPVVHKVLEILSVHCVVLRLEWPTFSRRAEGKVERSTLDCQIASAKTTATISTINSVFSAVMLHYLVSEVASSLWLLQTTQPLAKPANKDVDRAVALLGTYSQFCSAIQHEGSLTS